MRKGHHLSIEGIQKGYLLCQKWYKKDKGVGPRGAYGAASPCKRVSMGLTDRRKTAKNVVDSRKN